MWTDLGVTMKDLLKGAYDLHIHTSPDVSPRKCTDMEMAKRCAAAGMRGFTIKCHYGDTVGRAAAVREIYPELDVQSGLVLNRQAGGLNPDAVERMAQMGGKFLWFPTLDAPHIPVCDENGRLLPSACGILEIAAQYNLILCTGHIGAGAGIRLVEEAVKYGVKKIVLTHADSPITEFTLNQQKYCVNLGAVVEHSYYTTYYGRTSWEKVIQQIKEIGSTHILLTSDFGQPQSPYPDEGLLQYAEGLIERGIPEGSVEYMLKQMPAIVLHGKK